MSSAIEALRPTLTWAGLLPLVSFVEAVVLQKLRPEWHVQTVPLILVNATVLYIYSSVIYQLLLNPLRKLPQPPTWNPLLGQGTWLIEQPPCERVRKWVNTVPTPDGIMAVRSFFNEYQILPTSPAALKTVMADCSYDYGKHHALVKTLGRILGNGLITTEGDVHKFQRRRCMPSFQLKAIQRLYPLFWSKAGEMVNSMRPTTGNPEDWFEMELGDWATRVTLDVIGVAALGRDFGSLQRPNELVERYNQLLEPKGELIVWFGLTTLLPQRLVNLLPWKVNQLVSDTQRDLRAYASGLVSERRAAKTPGDDVLSLLVQTNDFTDTELCDMTLTVLGAGHETSAAAFSWVAFLLSQHPDIQQRLRDEIRTHIPASVYGAVTPQELEALPLLHGVVHETLRMYPTVPACLRETVRSTVVGNTVLPPQTTVLLVPWAINRNHAYWRDADTFLPDRWINANGTPNNNGGATSNYANITFLHGPRSCIGQGFAQAELKNLVAAFVGRYECKLARPLHEYSATGVVTIKPNKGMWLQVREVPGW